MARIRTVKPEFFTNEKLSALPPEIHLLAAGLLCYSDDEGYFNANPELVRAATCPLRKSSLSAQGMLNELSKIGYIRLGRSACGKRVGQVVGFLANQCINRPSASKLKELAIVWDDTHCGLTEDSYQEGKGKEGNGKEIIRAAPKSKPSDPDGSAIKSGEIEKPDPRHAPIRDLIQECWLKANPGLAAAPWHGPEAGQLGSFLKANKSWTIENISQMVRNRFLSDVNLSELPRSWISRLPDYAGAPLDTFKRQTEKPRKYIPAHILAEAE
jgi:hypothetical protein